ncbi:uncharacterized protein [Musca autumnalis]|uniref:uncharacterized protein n=1 Tax=Musca autumnalis TaxID=221902 RepID=UPI003CF9FC8E
MSNVKFESTSDYDKSLDAFRMTNIANAMSNLNLSNSRAIEFLQDSTVKFDLNNCQHMENDTDDYAEILEQSQDIDLNKSYSSKTMTKRQMILVKFALEDTEL